MLVYRIENPEDGIGPYRRDTLNWGDERPFNVYGLHPTPYDDAALREMWEFMPACQQEAFYFGFADEAQMRAWFYRDEWLRVMKDAGMKLTVWECKHARYGNAQAIFKREEATLILTRELI